MIYNDFKGMKLSHLGLGAMRFPLIDGKDGQIDEVSVEKMIALAMENGINYYDTAWVYHDGQSEIVLGKMLSKYPRDSYYLATKFPCFNRSDMDKPELIFEKQLEKCGVDYFDFYLIHNVCDRNIEFFMEENNPLLGYLLEQKANGRIRHLGFSTHATNDNFVRFLDAFGEHMEFCQIQLNYLDWSLQKASEKVAVLNKRNIPVWVMEPLRGGKLATLPENAADKLQQLRSEDNVPAWGFRFQQSVPGVTMVLSGMSNEEQILANLKTFESRKPLNAEEMSTLLEIAQKMVAGVPCTSCRYCTTYCPQELNIPRLIELYNEHKYNAESFVVKTALGALPAEKQPSACIGCRSCESVCPQRIKISEVMADFAASL